MRRIFQKYWKSEDDLPHLKKIVLVRDKPPDGVLSFETLVEKGSQYFTAVNTRAEDPAFISYTSGTTGPPKGAYHAHRVLLGHLPGIQFPHNFFPKGG